MSDNLTVYAKLADVITGLMKGLDVKKVTVDHASVEYLEAGEGEPIIFLHGFGGLNFQWRYWLDTLKGGYRVIAVTIPDLSPTLNFDKPHYSFRKYAEWLALFLEKLAIREAHLVSHCTGACIAAFYASLNPGKLTTLTLIAPPNIGLPADEQRATTFDKADLFEGMNAQIIDEIKAQSYYSAPFIPVMILKIISKRIEKNKDKVLFLLGELSRSSRVLSKRLTLIDTPTLIIGGQQDAFLSDPDALLMMSELIPECELVFLPECGYFPFQEQCDACLAVVRSFVEQGRLPQWAYESLPAMRQSPP